MRCIELLQQRPALHAIVGSDCSAYGPGRDGRTWGEWASKIWRLIQ